MNHFKLLLLAALAVGSADAQVAYNGGVYSQDFNSLPGTTNNTLNLTWTDNSTLPGWYSSKTTFSVTDGTVGGTATNFDSTSASVNNVGLFSFGSSSSTDRALGTRATSNFAGNSPVLHGVRLVNNTSQTLTRFTVTHTGEQWYASTQSAAHTLLMDYQFDASDISAGTWSAVTAATFIAPIATGTTARALDGNANANRTVKVAVVTGVSWAPGQELSLRFRDTNESGNEQGLAVDDFNFLADDETGLFFNGSSSYVTMGQGAASATAFGASNFTLECRFLRTGPGATASTGTGGVVANPLIAKGVSEADAGNKDANYFLGINAAGNIVADFEQFNATNNGTAYPAGQNFPITGSATLANGVWYHVAVSYDAATANWKLYVNGVEDTAATLNIPTFVGVIPRNDSIQGLGIGTTINSTGARAGYFNGIIDEARIWGVARTASDIANNKDVKIVAPVTGLLARYGFDEGTGTTAAGISESGAATSGTLAGTVLPAWVNSKSFAPNTAPTVSLVSNSGASVVFPASIELEATASDSDGVITKVEFFNGIGKIGEATTSPYTFSWPGAAVGSYTFTAVATDNGGSTTTSAPVAVEVTPNPNQPPVVTLTTPAADATGIGSETPLSLSINDPEGDATTVTFYGRKTTPTTPGPDFTVATLPDTQFYSENLNNNNRAATYSSQTQWLVDNRAALNLAFVSHMGDIVQNGDAVPAEWAIADAAMQTIESPANTLLTYGIPWGGAPGNHDQTSIGNAGGANFYFNQYFGQSRFAGRSYWGGSQSPTNNHNNYQLFSASGLDFIILHLEYDVRSKSSYQTVLDWADALLKANPDRRAIVTSHWLVNTGNPASFSTQGQNIYNDLKDNPNLFMMLCGHVAGEGRRTDTFEDRAVHSVLQDYQGRTNGGDGWLRHFIFSPANNTISARTYRVSNPVNPAAGTYETDADSQFDLAYNMQGAITGWIPLGTVNVPASGTTAAIDWTGLLPGSDYEWYANVSDGINSVDTASRRFSTVQNMPPTATIDSPVDGSTVGLAALEITASASDSDGTVAKVSFFDNGTLLGEDTTLPYAFTVAAPTPGVHSFTAVARDNFGDSGSSPAVSVTVENQAPAVTLTEPDETENFGNAPAYTHMEAIATDSDGTISKVGFYANAMKVGEVTTPEADGFTYIFNWTTGYTGIYALSAKAIDNFGAEAVSTDIANLTVTNPDNELPTVAITSPSDNGVFGVGSSITLNASAADTDGIVEKVEFFDGATKLGESLSLPFSFAWSGAPAGVHDLTSKATDNDGGVATSAIVTIAVATGPARPFLGSLAENFDSMGTSTSFLLGWSIKNGNGGGNSTWTDASGIPASGTNSVQNMVNTSGTLTYNNAVNGPAATNVNGYNLRGASDSDRALGTSPTGVVGVAIQTQLVNNSGSAITGLQISYDIRRYVAVSTAGELPGYWLFYSLDGGAAWTNVSELNPTLAGAGVRVPNTPGVTQVPLTAISLTSIWNPDAGLLLRWVDDNAVPTSPDHIYALDNLVIQGISIVGSAPVVGLVGPANNSTGNAPASFSLAATASDSDGTITKVEFYAGITKLGEDTTDPYTYEWTNVSAGSYNLTARATDNDGNLVISAPVSVTSEPPPSSGTLQRGPYLNSANQSSIVIRWRSSQSVAGRVRYGTSSSNLDQSADEPASTLNHEIKLTGLTPHTRYYYSVGSAYDTLTPQTAENTSFRPGAPVPTAEDYTFRTSPAPGAAVDTRIWIVGDCGRGTQTQANGRDAYYNFTGSRIPDLNLQMGDNAYNSGTDTEYQTGYFNMYADYFRKMPQWSTLGNHDANNGDTNPLSNHPYFDMFTFPTAGECGGVASGTEHYYSFDYGNIHFICLDSQASSTTVDNPVTSGVNEDGPMATWLRQDLASITSTWIIAFWHHPPYSKGSHNSDSETQMVNMRTRFNRIMEQGGVDLLFFGHSHNYERSVLLDGHYGTSGTITAAMKKNSGNGSTTGFTTTSGGKIRNAANGFTATATVNGAVIPADGAYLKPLTGPRDHFGAVYNTAGMSGLADTGSIDHTAMYVSYNNVGTVNLDVNGTTLTATFVQSGGATPDNFTIIKRGAADTDGDGISDEYEIANGLDRYSNDAYGTGGDTDGLSNLLEFAFGLNPNLNDAAAADVNVPGLVLNQRGTPAIWYPPNPSGTDFQAIFIRRTNATGEGLIYTPQFSGDLVTWVDSAVTPTVIATNGEVEAVSVNYPLFAAGKNARFFRIHVTTGNY